MPRTATRAPAPAEDEPAPSALPPDLPSLRGAPARLKAADRAHDQAKEAFAEAEAQHAELTRRLAEARVEESTARDRATRELSTRHEPANRGVTVTRVGDASNPASIGLQVGAFDAPSAVSPVSQALTRYTQATAAVKALEPLVDGLAETLPGLRADVVRGAGRLADAQRDDERFEAIKVQHAAPILMEADGKLEEARMESEAARDRLRNTFGFDERFSTAPLKGTVPAIDLAALHRRSFGLEG